MFRDYLFTALGGSTLYGDRLRVTSAHRRIREELVSAGRRVKHALPAISTRLSRQDWGVRPDPWDALRAATAGLRATNPSNEQPPAFAEFWMADRQTHWDHAHIW